MRIKNLPSISSMDGSQDALIIEQTDGSEDKSRKVSPAQIKQYVLGNSIDDIYSVMGQMGAKNLIPYPYYRASGYSSNGMTTTYDSDGVLTINKVAGSSTAYFSFINNDQDYCFKPNTKYKLLFELENANQLTIYLKYGDTDIVLINKKSTGKYVVEFTTPQTLQGRENLAMNAAASDTETNAKVKAMIMLASDTDDTYQPYAKTNKELTEDKAELESVREYVNEFGAKNLIPYPYASNSYSQRNIDFTCLSDGTINANGTNDGTGNSTYNFVAFTLSKGSYVINGCPIQTDTNYRCGVVRVSDAVTLASDLGSGANFTLDTDTNVRVFVQVYSGKTANNITFKPMLRLASDINDDTYVPYAMTNKQLTEEIGDLSQTGLTGDSVSEQLETAGEQIENLTSVVSGKCNITTYNWNLGNVTADTVYTLSNFKSTVGLSGKSIIAVGFNFIAGSSDYDYGAETNYRNSADFVRVKVSKTQTNTTVNLYIIYTD